jgi:mono/diheme cytochrome c family protein
MIRDGRAVRSRTWWRTIVCGALLPAALAAPGCGRRSTQAIEPGPIPFEIAPKQTLAASPELVALGKQIYEKQCAACHGAAGRGDGEAAYLLNPKPRDFTTARFRLVSTWDGVPTDDDLFRTVSRGIPGSAMPSWGTLSEKERWGLVHYVKSLAETPWTIDPPSEPTGTGGPGTGIIQVPPEPPYDAAARETAAALYRQFCASCHGPEARGDGPQIMRDDRGFLIRPRDLNTGVFKGSPDPEALYRRIVGGIPGTPMPANPLLHGDKAWHLVHWARSLSSDVMRERAEMKKYRIAARKVGRLPLHPDDGDWRSAPTVNLHLMPLWWRYERPEYLTVQAMHDGKEIAFLLEWADETEDHTAIRPQDFRDAAAIELALTPNPPFFAMGAAGQYVNIWMWKSERQADLLAFQDSEAQYPNIGIDSYVNLERSPLEQPVRHAMTLESDPTYVTGWGAGNIVSDPTRKSAAEDLAAQGFGTLKARPLSDQAVEANGVYSTGSYRVMFKRPLRGQGKSAATLKPGTATPVAFAIWNGSAGDRDGKKSVTIWQELVLLDR